MKVEEAVKSRRAVRAYKDKEIPKERLKSVLNAGRLAPSAKNRQDWKFIVVTNEEKKKKLAKVAEQKFIGEAGAVIAGVATDLGYIMRCGIKAGIVDVSIALDHLTLKAAEEGLGTCWIGHFNQAKAKEILHVPKEQEIVALMPIGYPKTSLEPREKPRKALEEVVAWESL